MATHISITPFGLDYIRRFTAAYRPTDAHDTPGQREARCEQVQFPAVLVAPRPADYLAGKRSYPELGYSVQYGGLGYYARFEAWPNLAPDAPDFSVWADLRAFWEKENTTDQAYRALPPSVTERVPHTFEKSPRLTHAAYTLYRMAGLQLDYAKLMRLGLPGLQAELTRLLAATSDPIAADFYQAGLASLQTVRRCAEHYLALSPEAAPDSPAALRATSLRGILDHAPRTFHEGLQLILLVACITATNNFGRLDVVLGPLLQNELDQGSLTREHALALLRNFYVILEEEYFHTDARITIGGLGRPDEAAADCFARLAMETTASLNLPLPQLTLRFHSGQNPALLEQAYDIIGRGKTFPMLYNDEVNVPAVAASFRVNPETAAQYLPYGCGEYMLYHESCTTPNAILNVQRCLESALNHGRCLRTGLLIGPDYGSLETYATFDDLWSAYTRTIEHFVVPLAEAQASIYQTTGRLCPFTLCSLLYDDCLALGRPLFAGGIRYLGGCNETYGNTNAADSLTAIKHLVFDDRTCTAAELLTALRDDWAGSARLEKSARALPKYGNDDPVADAMITRLHNHLCRANAAAGQRTDLHHFLVVIINNDHNTVWGRETSASADGRRHGAPLAPGNAPGAGHDRTGLTAVLNSQAKPDPSLHAGAVQNVKLSAALPARHPAIYRALFNTYFARGGAQAMITVTNRSDLEAALAHPENYGHLLVRVGGFSARFIDLAPETQREILSRTEHG